MNLLKPLVIFTLIFLPILASAGQKLEVAADIPFKADSSSTPLFDTGTFACELTVPTSPVDRTLREGALIDVSGVNQLNSHELDELEIFGLVGVRAPNEFEKAIQIISSDLSSEEKRAQLIVAFPNVPTIRYMMELQAKSLRTDTDMTISCSGDQPFDLNDILLTLRDLSSLKPASDL